MRLAYSNKDKVLVPGQKLLAPDVCWLGRAREISSTLVTSSYKISTHVQWWVDWQAVSRRYIDGAGKDINLSNNSGCLCVLPPSLLAFESLLTAVHQRPPLLDHFSYTR
jgi:hypothetical protein